MIEFSKEDYERMLKERDDTVSSLLNALHQVKQNKFADLTPLFDRLIHERNELDVQRAEAVQQFLAINEKYQKCKLLTERFDIEPTMI